MSAPFVMSDDQSVRSGRESNTGGVPPSLGCLLVYRDGLIQPIRG